LKKFDVEINNAETTATAYEVDLEEKDWIFLSIIHAPLSQQFPRLKVFISGIDLKSFEYLTKDHIFVIPNLVLDGLNRILKYNVSNKKS